MPDSKQDSQEKDFEKGQEEVGVTAEKENEGDECGDSSIEDGGAHVHQSSLCSLSLAARHSQEGVADVHWGRDSIQCIGYYPTTQRDLLRQDNALFTCIIDAKPNCDDDIHSTDHVYCQTPEMHVTAQVNLSYD